MQLPVEESFQYWNNFMADFLQTWRFFFLLCFGFVIQISIRCRRISNVSICSTIFHLQVRHNICLILKRPKFERLPISNVKIGTNACRFCLSQSYLTYGTCNAHVARLYLLCHPCIFKPQSGVFVNKGAGLCRQRLAQNVVRFNNWVPVVM